MKNFTDRYIVGIFFTVLPLVWLSWTYYSYVPLKTEETVARQGTLSEVPKFDNTGGESPDEYIELRFAGSEERYRFITCSYNDFVIQQIEQLTVGDSLTLLVQHSSDQQYNVRQAWSPQVDTILTFDRYNNCERYVAKIGVPKVAGLFSLVGLVMIVNAFINSRRDKYILEIPSQELNSIKLPLESTGDALTYISRNSIWPLVLLAMGWSGDSEFLFWAGVAYFLGNIITSIGRKYVIDFESVHVTSRPLFNPFKLTTVTIKYEEIDEVSFRTTVFERWKGLGSVLVSREKKENEEDAMSVQLHGIPNASHVARLILDLSKAKREGKV